MTVLVSGFQVIFWREKGARSRYSAKRRRPSVSWGATGASPPELMGKPPCFQGIASVYEERTFVPSFSTKYGECPVAQI